MRSEALKLAKTYEGEYVCIRCFGFFDKTKVQVDHFIPVGKMDKDLTGWAARLFCPAEGLQVLCKLCHLDKTHG